MRHARHHLSASIANLVFRAWLCFAITACNAPIPDPSTGGVDTEAGACGRGLVVVSSDYQSTNVSALDIDGAVLSASIVSSASESAALSAPLSGDVGTPTQRLFGPELVLLDRYPASVLTWIGVADARVRAQLDVSTGFAANPRDYLELGDGRAYVSRFESNAAGGKAPFDRGGDLLIVDSELPAITGRIDLQPAMSDAPGFLPRPSRMVRIDDDVFVLLVGYNANFSDAAASRLARIDVPNDTVGEVLILPDLMGCEGLAASPDGTQLAVSCSGLLSGGDTSSDAHSGLVLIDRASFTITANIAAADLLGQPLGFSVAFSGAGGVLVTALGAYGTDGGDDVLDALLHVMPDGSSQTILRSQTRPFSLGEVRCTHAPNASTAPSACGHCFVTDVEAGGLHRLADDASAVEGTLIIDDGIGLPPRTLGRF